MIKAEDGDINGAVNDIITLYKYGVHNANGPKILIEKLVGIALQSLSIKAAMNVIEEEKINAEQKKILEDIGKFSSSVPKTS